jgi:hypothetical protein
MARTLPLLLALVAGIGLPPFASAGFNVFTVGGDASCAFTSIQDAIDAAAAHPGEDYVFIAANHSYADQQLHIVNQDIDIVGGFGACDDFDPGSDQSTIVGTTGHSVFKITGTSHVLLSHLVITGAVMDETHKGGGIFFAASGGLTLQTSWVFDNQAGYGGGIAVSPTGPAAVNLIETTVSSNTALVAGGGIRIEGPTTLTWIGPVSYLAHNVALGNGAIGYGGGIEVFGEAVANISAVIDSNSAQYGGGVAVVSGGVGSPRANLYTSDANAPVTLHGNVATQAGGGIFVKPAASIYTAHVCAKDFAIDANSAADGAAIYVDSSGDTGVEMGAEAFLNPEAGCGESGAVACALGSACNEINDNVSEDATHQPTDGATVLVQTDGAFSATRFAARRNHGGDLLAFVGDSTFSSGNYMRLHDCVLVDNVETGTVVNAFGGGVNSDLVVDTCTIANNQLLGNSVVYAHLSSAQVSNSIVYQPDHEVVDFSGPGENFLAQYILTNDAVSLVGHTGIVNAVPSFVNAANGDYHLQRHSRGVDMAPALDGVDFDGQPRTHDLNDIANDAGPLDVGAYEIQSPAPTGCIATDGVYCDEFESQP